MRNYKILSLYASLVLIGSSCADFNAMEFEVEKPLSIAEQEEINAYGDLTSYLGSDVSDFRLGVSLPMSDYTGMGIRYRLINRNFNEFSPSSGMYHGTVVSNTGTINTVPILNLVEVRGESDMELYAPSLVWHQNQNSSYLNGLLSPLIVNSPAFANELNVQTLASGSWGNWSHSPGVSIEAREGMGGNAPAIKFVAGPGATSPESVSLTSPEITVIPGRIYEVIAYIKSDVPGEGRFTFNGLSENNPLVDWMGSGTPSETFSTNFSWKEIRFRVSDFEGDSFSFQLELGYHPSVTYYVDINNLYVYDIAGEPLINNLIADGSFESGTAWGGWGNNSVRGVTAEGQGVGNSGRAFFVTNPSLTGGFWEVQTLYQLAEPVNEGETYNLSFWVKGTADGVIRPELQSPNFSSNGFGMVFVTQDWTFVNVSTTVTAADRNRFIISYGEFAGTVYIDDVVLASATLSGGTTTVVERTPQEKTSIIDGQLDRWISTMVSETKDHITVREVLNEPIDNNNPSQLRSGVGTTPGAGVFYWQDYLGKDYGVRAFQLARTLGNPTDLLFINDSGLEANLDKCDGLLDYVAYLEGQGAQIDGIGTTMNLTLDSSMENIATMFQRLAATGKKIRVSGLEIRLMNAQPSPELLLRQSEMYRDVVKLYMQHVPASQQYGITLAGAIDSNSNNTWRQGLWDVNLTRKPSYAGFANGLDK